MKTIAVKCVIVFTRKSISEEIDLSGMWNTNLSMFNCRFIVKPPPALDRKDEHLGHVMINEKKNEAVRKHQVSVYC